MVEVFKTNVTKQSQANMLVKEIHLNFFNYKANFDLEDCDKILRVETFTGVVYSDNIIELVEKFGFEAEVLPDVVLVSL